MYVVLVEFTAHAKFAEQFRQRVMQQARDSLELEVDCHVFDVCVDSKKENFFLLYEVYSNKAAFDVHLASDHFRDFNATVQEWISEKQISTFEKL